MIKNTLNRILLSIDKIIDKLGCHHKWNLVDTFKGSISGWPGWTKNWNVYHYHCETCGKMKNVNSPKV